MKKRHAFHVFILIGMLMPAVILTVYTHYKIKSKIMVMIVRINMLNMYKNM